MSDYLEKLENARKTYENNMSFQAGFAQAVAVLKPEIAIRDEKLDIQDQIAWLTAELEGQTNEEECIEALNASGRDVPSAARYIKLNKLLKLGLAPRQRCVNVLEESNWNVELAASRILDLQG